MEGSDISASAAGKAFLASRMAALGALAASSIIGTLIFLTAEGRGIGHFRFYTIQSNILVAGVAIAEIATLLRRGRTGTVLARFRLASVIAILITGILFAAFLSKRVSFSFPMSLGNLLCHYLSPFGAPVVWLIFAEKGHASFRQSPQWLAFPLLYTAYALIQGRLTGFYPYWFLNPVKGFPEGLGSYPGVLAFVAAVSAAFLAIGSLLVLADKALSKKARPSS